MRILLTGAGGMVGRNLLEHPLAGLYQWLTPSSTELDLCVAGSVADYLRTTRPDMIIHCAGYVGGIQANLREPVRFLVDNLDMGRNLLMAARDAGITRLINLGSSCMYPRNAANPLREEAILSGELEPTNEGYALAKIAVQRLCEYLHRENPRLNYKTLIPCNLYGRWDKFDPAHSHMIPAVIRKLHEAMISGANSVEIWGDGLARREFMYAGDIADAILYAIKHFDTTPALINIGLGHDYSINEYYQVIAEVVGYQGQFIHNLSKPVGMRQKLVDISRQTAWGWAPRVSLQEGIRASYQFFLQEANT